MKLSQGFNVKQNRVAVLFGGRSAEHEISIITALQAIQAMDLCHYQVTPVYLALNGKWYTGDRLLDKNFYRDLSQNLSQVQEVTLLPDPSLQGLIPISKKGTFSLNKLIPIDIYFLAFHGQYGEDGCIQGLLELADASYTGCGVMASAVAMDKYQCKLFLQAHGIPALPAIRVNRQEAIQDLAEVRSRIKKTPGLEQFPLFVKPCHLGSSIGIAVAEDDRTLNAALAKGFQYDEDLIIEPCVTQLLEINISVLDGETPIASVVETPISQGALTYEDKYLRESGKTGDKAKEGMASLTRVIDPQDLDPAIKQQVTDYALKAFSLLKCSGAGRFDFILDTATNTVYFNELNPIPGSLAFYLWEKSTSSLLYTEVIDRMLQRAQQRKAQQLALQKNLGFKALFK